MFSNVKNVFSRNIYQLYIWNFSLSTQLSLTSLYCYDLRNCNLCGRKFLKNEDHACYFQPLKTSNL